MNITPEDGFKIGFLLGCAENGLTIDEAEKLTKKAVLLMQEGHIKKANILGTILSPINTVSAGALKFLSSLVGAVPNLLSTGATIGIGLPVLAGAGTGYALAKLLGHNSKSLVEDAKKDEIIGEYERLSEESRRRALLRRIQTQTGKRILPISSELG